MSLTLSAWEWLSLLGGSGVALVTLLFTLGRVLLHQVERRLDSRFGQLDTVVRANEQRLTQLLIDLPLQYQRREDSIRQEVAIIHRLDALATKVDHLSTCDLCTCPIRDHHLPGMP